MVSDISTGRKIKKRMQYFINSCQNIIELQNMLKRITFILFASEVVTNPVKEFSRQGFTNLSYSGIIYY